MAWTAQTGLGPRTVALSLKVFIVVMFYTHERLSVCTAQPGLALPQELQDYFNDLIGHFCTSGCEVESNRFDCQHSQLAPTLFCAQICNTEACNVNCWDIDRASLCIGNQRRICGYSNADVCQDKDGDRTMMCVYTRYPSEAFCICQLNPTEPYTRCDTQLKATAAQATTKRATTERATTAKVATTRAITSQDIAARRSTSDQPINVVGIVFGSLFALLLLFVIIAAVMLYLREQGRLPSFMKRTANPAGLSSVVMEARNSTRALPPEPSVPGRRADPNQDCPTYCSLGVEGHREGNPRCVLDGQRKIPATKELDTSADDTKDHPYVVLNRNEAADDVGSESGGGHADEVEVTDLSTGVQAKEAIEKEYTPLVPTGDPRSRTEQHGNEVAASPTSSTKPFPIDSPTVCLSNGDAGTYFPLILSAEPKSHHIEQSGYEDAKIPPSEIHDATSPTGAQSISCDENSYTPLIQAVKPKSQKEHSEYEVPLISKPGLAAEGDGTAKYDHLERKREKELKESAPDNDNYQQLVNNK